MGPFSKKKKIYKIKYKLVRLFLKIKIIRRSGNATQWQKICVTKTRPWCNFLYHKKGREKNNLNLLYTPHSNGYTSLDDIKC